MGLSEALVKVIFWPRVRKAKKIGDAAQLIGEGQAEKCLQILATMEKRIPPYLGHLFFLTRGRALDDLRRDEDAEQSYLAAVFSKQGATIAHLHLAILCGRLLRFDESRQWIDRIREDKEADKELLEQASQVEILLDQIQDGTRASEIEQRALAFAQKREIQDMAPARAVEGLDAWADEDSDSVSEQRDELACWLGQVPLGGNWVLSLNLEDSYIKKNGQNINPFDMVAALLSGEEKLAALVQAHLSDAEPQ